MTAVQLLGFIGLLLAIGFGEDKPLGKDETLEE